MKVWNKKISFGSMAIIFAITFLLASCANDQSDSTNIISEYYSAIEAGDAEAATALISEDAMIVTPSGNTLSGESGRTQFINYDLDFMDRVDFESDFTESGGKIMWSQTYHHIDGSSFGSDCEVTVQDGKIVEWVFN